MIFPLPADCPRPNWAEFFRVLCMHRRGWLLQESYESVLEMDETELANMLSMCPPPEGHPTFSITRQAIEWLQEADA